MHVDKLFCPKDSTTSRIAGFIERADIDVETFATNNKYLGPDRQDTWRWTVGRNGRIYGSPRRSFEALVASGPSIASIKR